MNDDPMTHDTDLDTRGTDTPTPKRRRSYHRNRSKPVAHVAPASATTPMDDIFVGMTVSDCCDDCNVRACVISGKPYCAHPRKGGLQSISMNDPNATKRFKYAKNKLSKQLLDARTL